MIDKTRTAAKDTVIVLAELFPKCFALFEQRRKPLKIGIREDVIAALNGAASPKEISLALAIYCGNWCYLKACKEGAPRIGLDGAVAGQVTADEAANAKQRLTQQLQRNGNGKNGNSRAATDTLPIDNTKPKRLGLRDLRAAAQARRTTAV